MGALFFERIFLFFGDIHAEKRARPRAQREESGGATSVSTRDELVTRLIANDVSALPMLMTEHGAHLFSVAMVVTNAPDLAAEVVQDAFVQCWNARATLDAARSI